jgi:glycosyltransferase involved in cell wall biosynthesis
VSRVSVVIPYFNAHQTIAETLASLAQQSYRDFDITIVDDGSTEPEAAAALVGLDPSIRILRQENRGLPGARNAGVAASTGELVLPLDSDDLLEPEALQRLVAALDSTPGADIAFSWARRFGDETGVSPMTLNPFEQRFLNQAPYCMLMRRRAVTAIGGWTDAMRDGYEDWEFNLRLAASGARAAIIKEPLFLYRVRAAGMLRSRTMTKHGEIWRDIRRRNAALFRPSALLAAWRASRFTPSVWPLSYSAAWGVVLALTPPRFLNTAYRLFAVKTRRLRDGLKARRRHAG